MLPVIIIGLIILGFAGFNAYQKWRDNTEKKAFNTVMTDVQGAYSQNNYQEAEQLLKKYLSKNRPKEYTYLVTLELASVYLNLENSQAALAEFKKAEALNPYDKVETRVYYQIATQSAALGEKQQAIDYLEKTIQATRADNDPFNDTYIPGYEQRISELKQ